MHYSRILHIIQQPNPTISVHSNIPDLKLVCLNFNQLFLPLFPVSLQIQNVIGFYISLADTLQMAGEVIEW